MRKNQLSLYTNEKKLTILKFTGQRIRQVSKKINNQFELNKIQVNPSLVLQTLQESLEKLASKNQNQVFLNQSKFWARAITWSLMGGTTFGIGWLAIAKTDEVVIALGKLEPINGVIDVQMPLAGIAREILVEEGETVRKGQRLILLDKDITEARNYALNNNLETNNTILKKLELLVNEGAVSELQYLQQKALVEDIKSEITTNEITLSYQTITSPADGIVFELQPKGPGYVANSSQPVLKIVPFDKLHAKIEIDSRTIGFVKLGKLAEISIDSFPATDFGVVTGIISKIGSDALPPSPSEGKGYRFPATITLDSQHLELKSGKKLPLQVGMSLNANIKLRKVTYLQLLLNNFTSKAESLKSI